MGQALLRGSTQIMSGSITADRFVSGLALASSQLADGGNFLKKDGSVAMTAAFNAGSQLISSVATPVSASDAATKSYVDSKVAGFQIHFVRLVSLSNVTLSGEQTVDGVTTSASRVLLTAQTTTSQNGIWITGSGSWTRPTDWAAASSLQEGQYVISDDEGTSNSNTKWFCTNTGTITVDTTASAFAKDSSGTTYTNGSGLSLTGSTFAVKTGNGIGFDGSSNVQAVGNAAQLITVGASGIGITSGTSAQLIIAGSGGAPSWAAMSGDVTISNTGVTTVASTLLRYASIITGEVPSGTINGTNATFTLANTPNLEPAVYLNGQRKLLGAGNDYTRSGATLTFLTAPLSGDQIMVDYEK